MSALTYIEPTKLKTVRILLYGAPGAGKTTGALSAPGPILVINADRPTATVAARRHHPDTEVREVKFVGKDTLRDVMLHLRDGSDVQTVVLDTMTEAYRGLLRELSGDAARPSQQTYLDAQVVLDRFFAYVRDLPVNLILLCHEEMIESDDALIVRPTTGGKKTPEVFAGQVDVMAYCAAVPTETGVSYMAQLVPAHGRRAKDGTGLLGAARPLNVGEWIATINAAQ